MRSKRSRSAETLATGKDKQYQGVEKYTMRDGKEHTFIITRTLFSFGTEKLVMTSALDISELRATKSSLLNAQDELARKNMTLSSALSLAKVIPWGCDLEKDIFYCDYDAYHPDDAPGPDEHGRYIVSMNDYFAGVHPDNREEAVRMIRGTDRRRPNGVSRNITGFTGSTNGNGNGCRCSATSSGMARTENPWR